MPPKSWAKLELPENSDFEGHLQQTLSQYMYMYIHTHTYTYVYIYVHINIYMYICTYICMYSCTQIYMSVLLWLPPSARLCLSHPCARYQLNTHEWRCMLSSACHQRPAMFRCPDVLSVYLAIQHPTRRKLPAPVAAAGPLGVQQLWRDGLIQANKAEPPLPSRAWRSSAWLNYISDLAN